MYSGSESADSQRFKQWAMTPSQIQNADKEQVDWAALAQQWIIMKEAGPPPIPGEQQEGGEAEMDMEIEKEEPPIWNPRGQVEAPPAPGAEAWANWNPPPTQHWHWNNTWPPPNVVPPSAAPPAVKTPLLPTPSRSFSDASDSTAPYSGFSGSGGPPSDFNNQPTFWTGLAVGSKITQTEIKPHNKRYSKVNVPTKVTIITPVPDGDSPVVVPSVTPELPSVSNSPPILDANKRKQLPAWIREGLEKMERDKLKQMEKEKEKLAREEYTEKIQIDEKEKMEILKSTIKERNLIKKSRFESDNEHTDDEASKQKSPPPSPVPLSPEKKMMKVRTTLTEILLNVTTEIIEQVCKEERDRYIKKRKASNQLVSAPSGAIIKAKLGLGAYDEDSTSSGEFENDDRHETNFDSDVELKETIKKRQAAFFKIEQEILAKLADEERKKKQGRRSASRASSRDSREKETQVEATLQGGVSKALSDLDTTPKRKNNDEADDNHSTDSVKWRRRSSSSSLESRNRRNRASRSRSRSGGSVDRRKKDSRYSPRRRPRSRSSSIPRSSRRKKSPPDRYRRDSTESRKRNRLSRSGSRYSKRSRKSRSASYSPRRSGKKSHRSRSTRSRSRDSKYRRSSKYESRSNKRSKRSRSRSRSVSRKKYSRRSSSRSRRSS